MPIIKLRVNTDAFKDVLSCNGPMIYIAAIVRTELDGLKKSPKPEVHNKIMCFIFQLTHKDMQKALLPIFQIIPD